MENEDLFMSEGLALRESEEAPKATMTRRPKRSFSTSFKKAVVAESLTEGVRISDVFKRHDIVASQLYGWRQKFGKKMKKEKITKQKEVFLSMQNETIDELTKKHKSEMESKNKELETLYSEIGKLTIKIRNLERK